MLRLIDDQFRRFIEGLDDRHLSENTLVLFLSDHGDFAGEYGLIRKGPGLPEILTRIPFIWRGPGIKAQGRVDKGFVNIVDIYPAICDILDIEIPFGVQGKSILPLLTGNNIPDHEFDTAYSESGFGGLYWDNRDNLSLEEEGASTIVSSGEKQFTTFDCLNSWTQCGEARILRKGQYKIQLDMMGNGFLYDLASDPYELANLFNDQQYLAIKADMLTELMAAALRACDPIPAPRRRYQVKIHPKGYWFQDYHTGG
jgi:arylsulfatase A-like enzyme